MLLSIIIPTYNEEATITSIVDRVTAVRFPIDTELIIIDDASIDRTYEKEISIRLRQAASGQRVRLFKNKLNYGKGFSIRKGVRRAKGDVIVIQDADNEYDPAEIPKLLEPILAGRAKVVYGSRFLAGPRPTGMAFKNWIANRFLTRLTNLFFGLRLTDMETCYKVITADLLKSFALKADRFGFEPEVTALLAKRGVSIVELPISYRGRTAKEGKKIKARDFFFAVGILVWQRLKF